jgi:hypothetical protein
LGRESFYAETVGEIETENKVLVVKRIRRPFRTTNTTEVASMRRILLVLAVAAMMLALTAGPALAAIPTTNPAHPTPDNGSNCIGISSSQGFKGPGGNPYSAANLSPTGSFNGPVTSDAAQSPASDFGLPSTRPNAISSFQDFIQTGCGK